MKKIKIFLFLAVGGFMIMLPLLAETKIYDPSPADDHTRLLAYMNGKDNDNQIPLILIHGIHGNEVSRTVIPLIGRSDDINNPNYEYWQKFIDYFYNNNIDSKYKVYLFFYESDKYSVWEIARSLRNKIDDAIDCNAGQECIYGEKIKDVPFVIVAHSMGGLVARSYMNEHDTNTGNYRGKRAGERILKPGLITLATPHHGTQIANNQSRVDGLIHPFWDASIKLVDIIYWDSCLDVEEMNDLYDCIINDSENLQACMIRNTRKKGWYGAY